jgi:hypothetical protein
MSLSYIDIASIPKSAIIVEIRRRNGGATNSTRKMISIEGINTYADLLMRVEAAIPGKFFYETADTFQKIEVVMESKIIPSMNVVFECGN